MTDPRPPERLLSRRLMMAAVASATLAGCGRKPRPREPGKEAAAARPTGVAAVLAGDWRTAADRTRDRWRHPAQSLAFWGLKPQMTVVEFWPGAGWYTDILGPLLTAGGGTLYAANLEPSGAGATVVTAYRQKIAARPELYGAVRVTSFGAGAGAVAPPASADMVLFLRNVHNWMAAGMAEKAFRDAFAALKPGGVLGVEEHRAKPGGAQDMLAADGYVQEAYVRRLAQEAGFKFAAASEINANPRDDRDHPFGVWTLPPTRLSAPRGRPADPAFDHQPYDAVGESDRMTLKFVKPV